MSFLADNAQEYLIAKAVVTEETPFGPDVLVYKVAGKMFATLGFQDEVGRMNLKCDPKRALELRDEWDAIIPGYHMNKKHWNTLVLDGSVPAQLIAELIDHSYDLVIKSMTKAQREACHDAS
ncbi:MmcQ/YjbR family DNA-binding protein [Akkermansiaceae bacterium]|nr:MmcQ/YjbR family DNA-binding protein [Akkermansiaceae bacterium]MDB4272125.1 MmcQ/YjbR family DNA-binding protein [bacterium]MDA7519173.1 MmcQ/YjbR family DNA-binding protein [Akkermansiaceae bacterium]MDB0055770.1 MmcQ/YjbR family DNA-binding protein [Akkermansiaceae bacterium]MDB4301689.1 MmcQ/YjbR family DNA-binding protein [Akkermansiaceae bacterium]